MVQLGGTVPIVPFASEDSAGICDQSIEQLILLLLESGDIHHNLVAMTAHGIGVTRCLTMLPLGQRCFRHQ